MNVPSSASQILAVPSALAVAINVPSGDRHTRHLPDVTEKREDFLAGVGIPNFDRIISAGGGDTGVVTIPNSADDIGFMSTEGEQQCARFGVPYTGGAIGAGRDDTFAIR